MISRLELKYVKQQLIDLVLNGLKQWVGGGGVAGETKLKHRCYNSLKKKLHKRMVWCQLVVVSALFHSGTKRQLESRRAVTASDAVTESQMDYQNWISNI